MDALRGPMPDQSWLARIIKKDPGLCFAALSLDRRLTPSTPPASPHDMERLVDRIGLNGIDTIVTRSLTVQSVCPLHHQQSMALQWLHRHACTTASLAQALAMHLGWADTEEVYIAGLLHVLGKLLLLSRTPRACVNLLANPEQAPSLIEAEANVTGSSHNRIGARLIGLHTYAWSAADAARYQAEPLKRIEHALPPVQMVWAAAHLVSQPEPSPDTRRMAAELLGIPSRQLVHLLDTILDPPTADDAPRPGHRQDAPRPPETDRPVNVHPPPWQREIEKQLILASVCRQLLTASDADAVMAVFERALTFFPGLRSAMLLCHDPERDRLVGRVCAGTLSPGAVGRFSIPLSATRCLPVRCHFRGEPMQAQNRDGDEAMTILDRQLMDALMSTGLVCLPVVRGKNGDNGCLVMGIDPDRWPELRFHMDLLTDMAMKMDDALDRVCQAPVAGWTTANSSRPRIRTRKIVHEINGPLSIIKNYLKVLALKTERGTPGTDEIRIVNEELDRMTTLVQSLIAPVPTEQPSAAVDVNATITDLVRLLQQGVFKTEGINANLDLEPQIPTLVVDRDRLKQALINLLRNAAEAISFGGTVSISTRTTPMPAEPTETASRPCIRISVCDDGPGIDHRIRKDLYRPFVTSKRGHDGLGLAIVREAVTSIGGELKCAPASGHGGTCFTIDLPINETESDIATAPHTAT